MIHGAADTELAAKRLTPTADTNEPGFQRISADQQKRSAQAMDGAGRSVRILQIEGHEWPGVSVLSACQNRAETGDIERRQDEQTNADQDHSS